MQVEQRRNVVRIKSCTGRTVLALALSGCLGLLSGVAVRVAGAAEDVNTAGTDSGSPGQAFLEYLGGFTTADGKWVDPMDFEGADAGSGPSSSGPSNPGTVKPGTQATGTGYSTSRGDTGRNGQSPSDSTDRHREDETYAVDQ